MLSLTLRFICLLRLHVHLCYGYACEIAYAYAYAYKHFYILCSMHTHIFSILYIHGYYVLSKISLGLIHIEFSYSHSHILIKYILLVSYSQEGYIFKEYGTLTYHFVRVCKINFHHPIFALKCLS